jgi:hypothetical protein
MLRLLLLAVAALQQMPRPARGEESACDWSLLGRKLEDVSDTCCFAAGGDGSSQPPLGNAARIRQAVSAEDTRPGRYARYPHLPVLTIPGSDPNGDDGIYCETQGGPACADWYMLSTLRGPAAESYGLPADDQCRIGEASQASVKSALDDCERLGPGGDIEGCGHLYPTCARCAASCLAALAQECLSECDAYFERKGQPEVEVDLVAIGDAISAACPTELAGCEGTCVADLANFTACQTGPRVVDGVRVSCEPAPESEVSSWVATLDDDSYHAFGECLQAELAVLISTGALPDPRQEPRSECRSAGVACEPEEVPGELVCTEMSCDATCDMHMQSLLGSCQSVVDALFDASDGLVDGVASTFAAVNELCPSVQSAANATARSAEVDLVAVGDAISTACEMPGCEGTCLVDLAVSTVCFAGADNNHDRQTCEESAPAPEFYAWMGTLDAENNLSFQDCWQDQIPILISAGTIPDPTEVLEAAVLTGRDKMSREACAEFAINGTVDGLVPDTALKVCSEDGYACMNVEDNMVSAAVLVASDPTLVYSQPWLELCTHGGVFEACGQVYDEIQNLEIPQRDEGDCTWDSWDPRVRSYVCAPTTGCTAGELGTSIDGTTCLEAPNLNWTATVLPAGAAWQDSLTPWGGIDVLKCAHDSDADTWDGEYCPAADSTWPTTRPGTGPMPATNEDRTGWADMISAYASKRDPKFRQQLAICEAALAANTAISEVSGCKGGGDWVPAGDRGTFFANCDACNGVAPFSFTNGGSSSICLSYFVGLMEYLTAVGGVAAGTSEACLAQFRSPSQAAAEHVDYMVNLAYDAERWRPLSFCDYTPPESMQFFNRGQPAPRIPVPLGAPADSASGTVDGDEMCRFDRAGNNNGRVDTADLLALLATFGYEC